ncbi:hypothetical protein BD413DRAFT_668392 [Trametes elegans]|nr:hypothetical protein BD413DRAFT_668392 [Trametes elegans]
MQRYATTNAAVGGWTDPMKVTGPSMPRATATVACHGPGASWVPRTTPQSLDANQLNRYVQSLVHKSLSQHAIEGVSTRSEAPSYYQPAPNAPVRLHRLPPAHKLQEYLGRLGRALKYQEFAEFMTILREHIEGRTTSEAFIDRMRTFFFSTDHAYMAPEFWLLVNYRSSAAYKASVKAKRTKNTVVGPTDPVSRATGTTTAMKAGVPDSDRDLYYAINSHGNAALSQAGSDNTPSRPRAPTGAMATAMLPGQLQGYTLDQLD